MITLDQFVATNTGKSLLFNTALPSLRGQCVQLVCFYNVDVLNVPIMWADAVEWWDKFTLDSYFTKVPYPGNLPRRGDIVVFNADTPGSAGAGHIDICIQDGTQNTFLGFDSNWNGKTAHAVIHDYKYVKGFLRPKGVNNMADIHPYNKGDAQTVAGLVGRTVEETSSKVDWNDVFYAILKPVIVDSQNQVAELKKQRSDPDGEKWRSYKALKKELNS